MYVSYNHKRIPILLNGRRKENGGWIPSVWDFNRKVNEIHQAALHQRCPFASEHIYEIENAVVELRESIQSDVVAMVQENRDVFIQLTCAEPGKFNVNGYSRISCMLAEAIGMYGDLLYEIDRRWCVRLIGKGRINEIKKTHETKIRRIKQQPFRYENMGITGLRYRGTLEWEDSVKKLGHEPSLNPYRPKYFSIHTPCVETSN